MKIGDITALAVAVVIVGCGIAYAGSMVSAPESRMQACTEEAKICPDGSAVGRTGPDCQFAMCPDAASTASYTCNGDGTICSDGTVVGRTGPECRFAACPQDVPVRTITVALNGVVNVRGESIRPVEVLEDSRCPSGVQCVWAGTVKVKVLFITKTGDRTETVTLGNSVSTETQSIRLVEVKPYKTAGEEIPDDDYLFIFEVGKI